MKKTLFVLFIFILVLSQPSYIFAESSIDVTRAHGNNVSDFYQPKGSIIVEYYGKSILINHGGLQACRN
ncbi:MAG: hypothetical protein Q4G17_08085 [Staphylococcus xylosus]|nr:hypothetical protein [Staphylococcus xylosus]